MVKLVHRQCVFPKGRKPEITVKKVDFPKPRFSRDESRKIAELKRLFEKGREGDQVRLSVRRVLQTSDSSVIIEAGDILYSEIHGVLHGTKDGERRLDELEIRPLISKNFIISADGFLLYSTRDGMLRTSLNGYVDSGSVNGKADCKSIVRTVLKELTEEYGLEGSEGMISIHSIHLDGISAFPSSVNVFGSVFLPLGLCDILCGQTSAVDSDENQHIRVIGNDRLSIRAFIAGEGKELRKLLEIHAARTLVKWYQFSRLQ